MPTAWDAALGACDKLPGWLETRSDAAFADHAALARARSDVQARIAPAASRAMGASNGACWVRRAWRHLAARAEGLTFLSAHADDHAAALGSAAGDWAAVETAVECIESWRRNPAPLGWKLASLCRLGRRDDAWPLLAELAWIAPARLDALLRRLDDPLLLRLKKQSGASVEGTGEADDLAWFPAWLPVAEPALAPRLALAQRSRDTPPERAMRLVLELLALERQGRHAELVRRRKRMRRRSRTTLRRAETPSPPYEPRSQPCMTPSATELFRHAGAEKAARYRAILACFATAKRQYRLQLRPEEVLAEVGWSGPPPSADELAASLAQLVAWGNLEAQPDMGRVTTLEDYYRAKFLYRLSHAGEAVEAAFERFAEALARRAELQTVALEDIDHRLQALEGALDAPRPDTADTAGAAGVTDAAKLHEILRDLVRVFEGLADNAQAFMAGVARSLELQRAEAEAVAAYKSRLIDYLDRFVGDLVQRSEPIARRIDRLTPRLDPVFTAIAEREARDAAPGDSLQRGDEEARRRHAWHERWAGLAGWFLPVGHAPPQAEQLRARARSAIPQLLAAIASVNERRSGRSDRSADFRVLAGWFAACADDRQAHRLARAAFALNPARHLAAYPDPVEVPASTPWADAPRLPVHPRLREFGEATARGRQPGVRSRDADRARLAAQLDKEARELDAARERLATGRPVRLSELGPLDVATLQVFLGLLGEALADQRSPELPIERASGDGLYTLRLEPLEAGSQATIDTPIGRFAGRDHWLTVTPAS